jgi:hypothetical protein
VALRRYRNKSRNSNHKDSSFSEEKQAKRLLLLGAAVRCLAAIGGSLTAG